MQLAGPFTATASPEPDVAAIAAKLLEGAGVRWRPRAISRIGHGASGDLVLRIEGERSLIAKVVHRESRISRAELAREAAALRWLDGRIGAPRVVWSGELGAGPALVTEALAGAPLHELSGGAARRGVVAAIAALAQLHALPVADCPFDERLPVKLAAAQMRLDEGGIDPADFDRDHSGRTPLGAWAELTARPRPCEDLVVTHGDACLPNFILHPDGTAAIIDLGRCGVADRHQDLALFVRSAAYNFPDLPVRALLADHYPVQPIDDDKLEYFRLLDEFC